IRKRSLAFAITRGSYKDMENDLSFLETLDAEEATAVDNIFNNFNENDLQTLIGRMRLDVGQFAAISSHGRAMIRILLYLNVITLILFNNYWSAFPVNEEEAASGITAILHIMVQARGEHLFIRRWSRLSYNSALWIKTLHTTADVPNPTLQETGSVRR
ncbi:2436_t:CDS:2, partial [Paraglomus occultum]